MTKLTQQFHQISGCQNEWLQYLGSNYCISLFKDISLFDQCSFPAKQGICTSTFCVDPFRVRSLLLKNDLRFHAFSPSLLQWYIWFSSFILGLEPVVNHGCQVQSILLYADRWRKVWEEMKSCFFQCKANVNCPILYLNSVWWFCLLSSPPPHTHYSFFFK